ncbi:MAG: hypothetical protein HZB25_11745 [Candidatus Eisenbacteria bacterium]|nr:hypothetical protein [Candidatus Eisenbacteria bacterium]
MYVRPGGERGTALVIAVMVLLAVTLLAAWFLFTAKLEVQISGATQRGNKALEVAEAGVEEAIQRLANGEVPGDVTQPAAVTQIYLLAAGSLPAAGGDTTNLPTAQALASALPYSLAAKGPDVLTVNFKTTPDGATVLRYNPLHSPRINTVSGAPIYQVRSTGTAGTTSQTVLAEVCKVPATAMVAAAVMADVGIQFNGNISVCGHDHSAATPTGTRTPDCNVGPGAWLGASAHGSCVYGGWSSGEITKQGSSDIHGEPTDTTSHRTGFFNGPWEPVGLSQADFWAWMGAPFPSPPDPPNGILYLDDDGIKQNQSGHFAYHGGDGEGFLYVDGDLQINGNFTYRGLIYVEGDLSINGTCWILGALVVKGKTTIHLATGDATVLYSGEAIEQALERYSRRFTRISWRVLPRD